MVNIQLKRSGGLMGKTLSATGQFDLDEDELKQMLPTLQPEQNKQDRDALKYHVVINDGQTYAIDATKAEGKLKDALGKLEDKLTAS